MHQVPAKQPNSNNNNNNSNVQHCGSKHSDVMTTMQMDEAKGF